MASSETQLDFSSDKNQILLNPRWPETDSKALRELAESVTTERNLHSHLWVATSGSTATSVQSTKLVALSKEAVLSSARSVNAHLQITNKDRWTQVLPSFHVGGIGIEARAFLSGAQVIKAFKDGKWDVDYFYQQLTDHQCTLSALVPTQVYDLIQKNYKSPTLLRAVVVGGGSLDTDLYQRARALGWPLLPSYGMTETCSQIATATLDSLKNFEFPDVTLLSHAEARTNSDGFLEVSTTSLFTCYAQNAQDLKSWDPKKDSWFTTEDKGEVQNRSLIISGRSKDYVKIGGEGTNVARLRTVLEQTARELNAEWPMKITLLDVPSERLGAEVQMVSTLDSTSSELLAQKYGERVLPFEKIRKINYLKDIPRSDLGKILWGEVRRHL
ncbi:2-succinylbenzoate--CoA ligase [compost metagenome]